MYSASSTSHFVAMISTSSCEVSRCLMCRKVHSENLSLMLLAESGKKVSDDCAGQIVEGTFFSTHSTSDKTNIMLLCFKQTLQTVLKHRKQLKCLRCSRRCTLCLAPSPGASLPLAKAFRAGSVNKFNSFFNTLGGSRFFSAQSSVWIPG